MFMFFCGAWIMYLQLVTIPSQQIEAETTADWVEEFLRGVRHA